MLGHVELAGGRLVSDVFYVRDLKGATIVLPTIVAMGDTVLFENDLPDQYT